MKIKTKVGMIDKTKLIDIKDLEAKIADLFEVEPRSFDEFAETGASHDEFPMIFLSKIRTFVKLNFNLKYCSDSFSLERICVAALKDKATFLKPTFTDAVSGIMVIGLRFKADVDLDIDWMEFRFKPETSTIIHHELRRYPVKSEIFIDDFLRDGGYFDAIVASPCVLTDYIKKPTKSWRNSKTPAELLEYDQQRRKNLYAARVAREIEAGLRDPETGKLLNASKPGPKSTLTPEERAERDAAKNREYAAKRRASNKQVEIDSGLRDPETGKLFNAKKPGPKSEISPTELAESKRKYARDYAAKKRKILVQAEIDAGIRDADGKLIK